jgi:hypothetical protein
MVDAPHVQTRITALPHSPAPTFLTRHRAAPLAILLLVALVLRGDTFGDPNLHGDEVFYQTVGIAMHHGALPYVDIWDRKPFGLFALYWLIAAISEAPLAYQLAATLFAMGTAWCIALIAAELQAQARPQSHPREAVSVGGLLAGIAYLLWLAPLQGFGGQSPVFYNLFIAAAALLVIGALPALRAGRAPGSVAWAMLLAGAGITIKTTALVEAAFLGLCCAITLWRSGVGTPTTLRRAVLWAAIGAAPALTIAATYWAIGHWPEYWHAMVTANLSKPPNWPTARLRAGIMLMFLAPILAIAAFGLVDRHAAGRGFMLGWIAAAVGGVVAMPNFYLHYALPLVVPLCVAAGPFLARGAWGVGAAVGLAVISASLAPPFQYAHTARSRAAIDKLETAVREHIGDGPLLIYDGPPQLYLRTGQRFITPLVFPTHLSHLIEKDVSHLSTLAETERALAQRPGAVVMAVTIRNGPVNEETHALVLAYVGRHCRPVVVVQTPERMRTDLIAVWGDCRGSSHT